MHELDGIGTLETTAGIVVRLRLPDGAEFEATFDSEPDMRAWFAEAEQREAGNVALLTLIEHTLQFPNMTAAVAAINGKPIRITRGVA